MTVRRVAAAQLGPASSDRVQTVARMVDLLDEAIRRHRITTVVPGDDLVVAEIDFAAAAEARADLDLAANRRTDQYSAITAQHALAGAVS